MSAAAAAASVSSPLRVALIGAGLPGSVAGALADGLLQDKYKGKVALTVLSRPLGADASESKRALPAALTARGASVVTLPAKLDTESLTPLLKGFDVVLSSLGSVGMPSQEHFIRAAAAAGVKWFVPSEWAWDGPVSGRGSVVALVNDIKMDHLELIKKLGLDWTVFNTGSFTEYALDRVFGVLRDSRTVVFPNTGKAAQSTTPLRNVGEIVADALVTGRGRNQVLYTATATPTWEELADTLDKVSGEKWTRVVRTTAESQASVESSKQAGAFFPMLVSMFELYLGSGKEVPNPAAAWPLEKTYNVQHNIPMESLESVIKRVLAADAAKAKASA